MRVDVLIIGGGASGTLVAAELLRQASKAKTLTVAIAERTGRLAEGIAYSTREPEHLLNVPAAKMSGLHEEPQHFQAWLCGQDARADADTFAPRMQYRAYLEQLLPALAERSSARLTPVFSEVTRVRAEGAGFVAELAGGEEIQTKAVVLALGHSLPSPPRVADDGVLLDARRYRSSPWDAAGFDDLPADADVLMLGTGLTTVDAVLSLQRRAHRGTLHATSRHGLLPMRHSEHPVVPHPLELGGDRTLRGVTRALRRAAKESPWRGVVDGLRPVTAELWQGFSASERARFLRHARTYWDVHRHRMAPAVADAIYHALVSGRLQLHAGRLLSFARKGGGDVEVRLRARQDGSETQLRVQRIYNCTGPSNLRTAHVPLLDQMTADGLVAFDVHGFGLHVHPHTLRCDGAPLSRDAGEIYALGPLARGVLWESVAIPEIREQAHAIARELVPPA